MQMVKLSSIPLTVASINIPLLSAACGGFTVEKVLQCLA